MKKENSESYDQGDRDLQNLQQKNTDQNSNPYDSENLDNESDSELKDITEQDIENDLKNNDPSEGFETEIDNPNNVKVVVDQTGFALYFSRSVIPYPRDKNAGVRYFQHIGIYAFRKQAIMDFYSLPMKSLEASEKLEQLRYLEFGKRIKMVETPHIGIGIDTPEDLEKARLML